MNFVIQTGRRNKILRAISSDIKKEDIKNYVKLGEVMIKIIKNPKTLGVGLAAPQIGINKRIICISLLKHNDDTNYKTIYMINPKILEKSAKCEIDFEGCLSVPNVSGKVLRNSTVKVSFLDGKYNENILVLSGISSRIVQHEIDHLDGVLFTDRVIVD